MHIVSGRPLRSFAAAFSVALLFVAAPLAGAAPAEPGGCCLRLGSKDVGASATDQNVLRATLPNGLRVILVRNTLAPVVATSVNYLVGSDEAPKGFPGTAHALEHMMFRGSPGLSADQLANIGSFMGGDFNANTRESVTQYLYTVPSEDLDVALHIEALRMQGVTSSEKDWEKERGAIDQEVAQDISIPGYKLYEKLRAELFAGTPYEHDALGTRESFAKTTGAMLRKFHNTWYAPNNAVLVVAGDLDPQAALVQVKKLFGSIKARKLPKRPAMKFRPVKPKSFTIDSDYPNATRIIALRLPGLDSKDFPALEVLSDVLSSRRFDLFGLVASGKALSAGFYVQPLAKASIGYAAVSYAPGVDGKAVEAEVRAILAKVVKDGVPPDLVAAAKLQERRSAEMDKNSIADLASVWADAVTLYGLKSPEEDLKRIEKVTVADVNRVARKYLKLNHAISGYLRPRGSGKPVASGHGFGPEKINLGEAKPTPLPEWAESALNRLTVPKSTLDPVVSTLPNGIKLIVQPETVSDTVTVYGHIRNRPQTEEAPGKEGVSMMLGTMLNFGTEHLNRLQYEAALDAIGASASAGTTFSLQVLAQDFDRGVELLADNELHPAMPEAAFNAIKPQIALSVASRNSTPGYLAQRSLIEALYPPTDPSLRQATGKTVSALTIADLRDYYHTVFRPDMTSIVVIGKITPEKAKDAIEKYFGGWKAEGPKPPVDLPEAPANKPGAVAVPDLSRVQDSVVLAQNLAMNRANPDYYALSLGNQVLGGGFYSTRLSIDLRKNAGLVYSVGSSLQTGRTRGLYYVQYACDPQNVGKAAAIVAQELKTMQTKPVSGDELERVKAMVLRQLPLSEDSVSDIARGMLDRIDLDLPLDEPTIAAKRYIQLKPADIQAAFTKWIRPNDLVRITQGPPPQ